MTQCDFHREREEYEPADARVVVECPDRDRIQLLCGTCIEIYSDAVRAVLGPIDPRDVPESHRSPTLNRFIPKINFPNDHKLVEECWMWDKSTVQGYGAFRFDGQTGYAHRYSWEYAYREPAPAKDEDLELLHECDNKLCVNPAHLWLGTRKENLQHAAEKGKMGPNLLIDEDTEQEIRRRYETEDVTQADLADEHGVTRPVISKITRGVYR